MADAIAFAKARIRERPCNTCARTLKKGDVKRVMQRGPFVGYFLCCPGCQFTASYLDDACQFVEDPPHPEPLPPGVELRRLVGITNPPACFKCRRLIRVGKDGALEAVDPAGAKPLTP